MGWVNDFDVTLEFALEPVGLKRRLPRSIRRSRRETTRMAAVAAEAQIPPGIGYECPGSTHGGGNSMAVEMGNPRWEKPSFGFLLISSLFTTLDRLRESSRKQRDPFRPIECTVYCKSQFNSHLR